MTLPFSSSHAIFYLASCQCLLRSRAPQVGAAGQPERCSAVLARTGRVDWAGPVDERTLCRISVLHEKHSVCAHRICRVASVLGGAS
jgi:hypothetical protein